jgi:hypothetical protein
MIQNFIENVVIGFIAFATIIGGVFSPASNNLGTVIPTPVASFNTSLASKITSTDTSMSLVSITTDDGTSLTSGTVYGFVIDVGTSDEEYVIGTASSTSIVSMTRGVSVITGNTEISALKKDHRRGSSVKITDAPVLLVMARILNGDETLPNLLSYDATTTPTSDTNLVHKFYVDAQTAAGSPVATTDVAGIGIFSTISELISGTATKVYNSVTYSLFPKNSYFNATSTATTTVPVTGTDGKLSQGFIDLTEGFTFSGGVTSTGALVQSGTSTFSGTTTLSGTNTIGTSTINGNLTLSNSNIVGSAGYSLLGGMKRIYVSATNLTTSDTATETFVSTTTIPANTLGTTGGVKLKMKVNWGTSGSGAGSANIKVYYGGSLVATYTDTYSAATTGDFIAELSLFANSSTTAQIGIPTASRSDYSANHSFAVPSDTTASVNSASAQNLSISVYRGGATGVGNIVIQSIEIYKILGTD